MKKPIITLAALAWLATAAACGRDQSCVRQAPATPDARRSQTVVG